MQNHRFRHGLTDSPESALGQAADLHGRNAAGQIVAVEVVTHLCRFKVLLVIGHLGAMWMLLPGVCVD